MSGEFELIAALRDRARAAGAPDGSSRLVIASGDDAAVSVPEGATATSVDALVEGVHFRVPPFTLANVGHKALAVALSDLAAMGAEPGEAYVQLGVSERFDADQLLGLADGLGAIAGAHRVVIAGGDVVRAPALLVALTVVGHAPAPGALVGRAGAGTGDVIAVTGELGGAAAGLLLLERPELGRRLDQGMLERLRSRQLEPQPRLAAGRALAAAGASAMIDVSDGLGGDAAHLARASSAAIELELDRLPLQSGVREVAAAAGVEALDLAVAGGEDYELLVALPADRLEIARDALGDEGLALTAIGEVADGDALSVERAAARLGRLGGFDQLRRRSPGDRA